MQTSGHSNAEYGISKRSIPMANSKRILLSHPDSTRRYRNFTDSVLLDTSMMYLRGVADYHRR